MFGLFGNKSTSKADVVMAVGAAFMALWKAYDTTKDYREEHAEQSIEQNPTNKEKSK